MKQEVRAPVHQPIVNNFVAREGVTLGQSALHELYAKEENKRHDLIDYALLDNMHEIRGKTYGKPYKPRYLEPSMYDILTGGYVSQQDEYNMTHKDKIEQPPQEMTEEELKKLHEAMLRKEIGKGKWMTETRDHFRKFTDSPNRDMFYIGNNMILPHKLANMNENHYLSSYKRDYGEDVPEGDYEEPEIDQEPIEEDPKPKKTKKRSTNRAKSPGSNSSLSPSAKISKRKGTPKQKKLDIKKWVYERNKALYGKPLFDKSKMSKEDIEYQKKLDKAISISRWNPDTHLKSMHGKPIWHSYGNGNTDPTVGGVVYGNYLLSHNVNPHAGENRPLYQQVYTSANNQGFINGKPVIQITKPLPETPKISKEALEELKNRNPIMPGPSSKNLKRHVKQLDLLQEPCFASKHTATVVSDRTQQVDIKSNKTTPKTNRKSLPKSEKSKKSVKTEERPNTDNNLEIKQATEGTPALQNLPVINFSTKSGDAKPFGPNTMMTSGNMKTMASTGAQAQIANMQPDNIPELKSQTEINYNSKTPVSGPIINQTEDKEADEKNELEVDPTVFPAGFPF